MASNHKPFNPTDDIDQILRHASYGTRSKINEESYRGLDIIGTGQTVIQNRINQGMVFFTRPLLNLTYGNLTRSRDLLVWRDSPEYSIARMTRAYLDPLNNREKPVVDGEGIYRDPDIFSSGCPLVDPKTPFINILSNNLLSMGGWQDIRMDTYQSDKGIRNEQWIMADGVTEIYSPFTLDCTFRNPEGDPITMLFYLWLKYISCVRSGILYPYPIMIGTRQIDYMTRIYNFCLDANKKYITHWAACGAGFPTNLSMKVFDYDYDKFSKENVDQTAISFQCVGINYDDPIVLFEFNKLVAMFEPELRTFIKTGPNGENLGELHQFVTKDFMDNIPLGNHGNNDSPNASWIKLRDNEKTSANYHVYPLINTYTKELEWWMRREEYFKYVYPTLKQQGIIKRATEQQQQQPRNKMTGQ